MKEETQSEFISSSKSHPPSTGHSNSGSMLETLLAKQFSSRTITTSKLENLETLFEEPVDEGELVLNAEIPKLKWCAFCRKETITKIVFRSSAKTLWSSIGIFLMGGVCGCFMLPYMNNSCKTARQKCSVCKRFL